VDSAKDANAVFQVSAGVLLTRVPANDADGQRKSAPKPAGQIVKTADGTSQCRENLKRIGSAVMKYHDEKSQLPAASWKPGLSWRVEILPHLGHEELYKAFRLDEPWDGPNNKKLLARMPDAYRDPRFQKKEDNPTETYFRGFDGAGGVFGTPNLSLGPILNAAGTDHTLLVVEAGERVPWSKPDELHYNALAPDQRLPQLGGPGKRDFFLGLFCDGHVQRVPLKTEEDTKRVSQMINWMNTVPFNLPEDTEATERGAPPAGAARVSAGGQHIAVEVKGVLRFESGRGYFIAVKSADRADPENRVWLWISENKTLVRRLEQLTDKTVVAKGNLEQMPATTKASVPALDMYLSRFEIDAAAE
jgi:hypothetical protein